MFAFAACNLLVPRSPAAAVAAVALVASTPAFVNVSALIHNDALGFSATTIFTYAVLAVAIRGPSMGRLAGVAAGAALAASARFASMVVVVPGLVVVAAAFGVASAGSVSRRAWRGALALLGLGGIAALPAAWFYLRNVRLYGDPSAARVLMDALHRKQHGTFLSVLVDPSVWATLVDHLWVRLAGGVVLGAGARLCGRGLVLVGVAFALVALARQLFAGEPGWWRGRVSVSAVLVAAAFACVLLPIFEFRAQGGNVTSRYYFPLIWAPVLAVAVGLTRVRSSHAGLLYLAFAALLAWEVNGAYLRAVVRGAAIGKDPRLLEVLAARQVEGAAVVAVLAALAFGAGLLLVLRSFATLHAAQVTSGEVG